MKKGGEGDLWASQVFVMVKILPANTGDIIMRFDPWMGRSPGGGVATPSNLTFTFHFHALEKEMATRSSVLAWRIPGTGEPGGLPSMGSHRVRHDWSDLAAAAGRQGKERTWVTWAGSILDRWKGNLPVSPHLGKSLTTQEMWRV